MGFFICKILFVLTFIGISTSLKCYSCSHETFEPETCHRGLNLLECDDGEVCLFAPYTGCGKPSQRGSSLYCTIDLCNMENSISTNAIDNGKKENPQGRRRQRQNSRFNSSHWFDKHEESRKIGFRKRFNKNMSSRETREDSVALPMEHRHAQDEPKYTTRHNKTKEAHPEHKITFHDIEHGRSASEPRAAEEIRRFKRYRRTHRERGFPQ